LLFPFWGRGRIFQVAVGGLVVLLIGGLTYAYLSAGEIYEYQDTVDGVHLPQIDAIVCLAGGRGRIAAAADLWYRYWEISQAPVPGAGRSPVPAKPPILYLSGMGPQSNWNSLKRQVRRGVLSALKTENVVLETESSNTEENAKWLVRYARERGWERVLLMTSPYHMKRARMIFERVLEAQERPLLVETLSVYQEPFEQDEWRSGFHGIRVTLIEYFKLLWYRSFWEP
jgi:uncharacterized SAM-binding protein YcdF (DUF218 family)